MVQSTEVAFPTKDRGNNNVDLPTVRLIDDRLANIFGTPADAAWDGLSANPLMFALVKRQLALLAATDPSLVGSLTKRVVAASFARPANTTSYGLNQLIAPTGTITPLEFVGAARVNGGKGTITAASVRSQSIRAGGDLLRLHIFRDAPVITGAGDQTAFLSSVAGRAAVHLGSFDIAIDTVFTDGTLGHAGPRSRGSIVFECGATSTSLFGLLETKSPMTGISGEQFGASLEVVQD